MALTSAAVTTGNLTVYTSSGNNAITTIVVCNVNAYNPASPTANTAQFTLWAVPNGSTANNSNMMVNAIPITAGETLSLEQERLVLGNGDSIVVKSDTANALAITLSTMVV